MMPRFVQRLVAVAVTVMLIEVTHKVSTLQQLLEFQDQATKAELQAWNIPTAMTNRTERASVNFLPSRIEQAPPLSRSSDESACRIPPSQGPEGRMGFQALTKIQLSKVASSSSTRRRILCIVLTDSSQHETLLQAAVDTYAPLCDGFLAASNQTDIARGAIDLGDASNEWERLQRVWNYVREHDRYRNDFDAFHFGGDGMYVIPENLRTMLSHYDQFSTNSHPKQQQPMYLGGAVVPSRKTPNVRYCGGGAGYTLNRAALDLAPRLSECPHNTQSLPVDQQLAQCLGQVANLQCGKTADSTSALRYLEFGLDYQAKWSKSMTGPIKSKPLAEHHGIYMRPGLGSIAADAVSFHLVDGTGPLAAFTVAETMRRVHAILRGHCKGQWDQPTTALDAQGNPGYVHDPTHLRKHPLSFTTHAAGNKHDVCEEPFGSGIEGTMGHQGLQKIRVMSSNSNNNNKVLCLIYTHSERHDRVRAIAETYGARCDGFLAASNLTDPSIGAVNLQHEGPEEYENMWLKVRAIWQYVYQHYLDDYDFFHIGGDDHYVIPENLRYVSSTGSWKGPWNQSRPMFLGGNMIDFPNTRRRYCGGGSGYTLNRVALTLLIERLLDTHHCRPHHRASDEDRIVSNCFRSVGIDCMDTNDEKNETRYHQASAEVHATWKKDLPSVWRAESLHDFHGIVSKEGLGQISETSVSFHLKGSRKGVQDCGIRRYHAILYDLCKEQ